MPSHRWRCGRPRSGCPRRRGRTTSIRSDVFFFSSRRRHTRLQGDWSSDVCSSDLVPPTTVTVSGPTGVPLVWPPVSPEATTKEIFLARSLVKRVSNAVCSGKPPKKPRSEEHTSELQSPCNLVCRLLLEKKNDLLTTAGGAGGAPHNPFQWDVISCACPPPPPRAQHFHCLVRTDIRNQIHPAHHAPVLER